MKKNDRNSKRYAIFFAVLLKVIQFFWVAVLLFQPPIVLLYYYISTAEKEPQSKFGVSVLLLGYQNSTAIQIWGCGTFITSGTFI